MRRLVHLKDVAMLLNGRAYKQDELLNAGKYPVLRVGNFFSNKEWYYSDLELEEDKYCDNGDLLFAWSASFGPKIWHGGKAIFHYHIWKIVTTDQINKKYLYYYLENAAEKIKAGGRGIAMIHTTKSEMEQMELQLPVMEKQLQIAKRLDKISSLVEQRKQQLEKLDELVKARFVEMFGNPVKNDMGWECKTLNDVCDGIGDGLHGTPEYDEDGDYPFINGNNLIDGEIVITPLTKMVSEETYRKHLIDISHNAILISINGTLGKLAFYNGEKVILGKSACYCNLKPSINKVFVYGVMRSDAFAEFLDNSSTKSTIKNVGLKAMREYMLILPPIELQKQFATYVEQTDKSKVEIKRSLERLETLKKALMQKYFG